MNEELEREQGEREQELPPDEVWPEGQPPRVICGALKTECRRCDYRFAASDSSDTCPECGESRLCRSALNLYPNGRCKYHYGAASIQGEIKSGLYTKAFKAIRARDLYNEMFNDPRLRDYASSLALLASRVHDLIEGIKGADFYEEVYLAWKVWKETRFSDDPEKRLSAQARLDRLIEEGLSESRRWEEITRLEDQLNRVREKHDKREAQLRSTLTVGDLYIIVTQLQGILLRHVTDRKVLSNIQREIDQIVSLEETQALLP